MTSARQTGQAPSHVVPGLGTRLLGGLVIGAFVGFIIALTTDFRPRGASEAPAVYEQLQAEFFWKVWAGSAAVATIAAQMLMKLAGEHFGGILWGSFVGVVLAVTIILGLAATRN